MSDLYLDYHKRPRHKKKRRRRRSKKPLIAVIVLLLVIAAAVTGVSSILRWKAQKEKEAEKRAKDHQSGTVSIPEA